MQSKSPGLDALILPTTHPASHKRYLTGSRVDLRMPYREIEQSPTQTKHGPVPNPPLPVYDSSGPYTDPDRLTRACHLYDRHGSKNAAIQVRLSQSHRFLRALKHDAHATVRM